MTWYLVIGLMIGLTTLVFQGHLIVQDSLYYPPPYNVWYVIAVTLFLLIATVFLWPFVLLLMVI